ncbi:MAG: ABC transporter permease [Elusimicrobia bacterium]|nr:ABC transporter permease [Elusimicrobiota bacterium]
MNFHRVAAVLLRYAYLIRGSLSRVFPLFTWVAIDMVLWGYLTRYLNTITTSNFVPTLLGAVLLWNFFIRVMQGVTMIFFEDVWSRNFLNVFSTPISVGEYLLGLVLSSVTTSLIGLGVMLALATAVFGFSGMAYGAMAIPFLLVLFVYGISMGILGCALVLRLGPAAEWFIWPIPALLSPFVGVLYPLDILPAWMREVARVLPASYVFESLRSLVLGHAVSFAPVLWGMGLAGLHLFAACWVFRAVFRRAVRTGLIARYSSESIS